MTIDHSTDDRRLRCQRRLLTMRLLVLSRDSVSPFRLAADVRDATNAVIAEVEAMSRAAVEASRGEPGNETFLWVRVTRLAMAADRAVNAARSGDLAGLDGHLRHFDALTSAIWTVRDAVYGPEPTTSR